MQNRLLLPIIMVSIILGAATLTRGHDWGDDFASYIMQAESIWHGTTREFVQHNSFTIFESSNQIGPVAYPWGYPLILTPVYAVRGLHPLSLKLPGLFFYAGFLTCLYLLMRTRLTRVEILLLISLFAFNPLLIQSLDQILSDIPFLFFSTLALLLMADANRYDNGFLALLGITMFLAFFIRTTGAVLPATFVVFELVRARDHRAEREFVRQRMRRIIVTSAVFGLLFLVSLMLFPSGEASHLVRYQELRIENVFGFAVGYFQLFSLFFGTTLVWKIVFYVVVIFFLIGAWIKRKDDALFIIFFALWMILLITWPAWQGPRFIFPLLPIFMYFAFRGIKFTLEKVPVFIRQAGQWIFNSFWLLIAGVFLFTSGTNAYTNLQNKRAINGPFDSFSREVYDYIGEQTSAASVIIFFKPRAMRLMTNRDSIMSTECERILKGDYLVLSTKVGPNQQIPPEEIDKCSLPLNQVLKNNRFIVYQIQK